MRTLGLTSHYSSGIVKVGSACQCSCMRTSGGTTSPPLPVGLGLVCLRTSGLGVGTAALGAVQVQVQVCPMRFLHHACQKTVGGFP